MKLAQRTPDWSVQDARAMRAAAQAGQSPLRDALTGTQADLNNVAAHMNRNRDAFSHYDPRQGDVIVSAYFKAGTNWIMHVCHQICWLGAATFDHIQDVIPWPDAAEPRFWVNVHDDTARDTPTNLRVIKSHLAATHIPLNPAAKYIAVTRDPKDCAASAYYFFQSVVFGPTMPTPAEWLSHFRSETPNFGRWDDFTASWYQERRRENMLFLCFEDVKSDNASTIKRIADFLDVTLTAEQFDAVVKRTSIDAMKAINHKFYPARQSQFTDPDGKIIRNGGVGDGRALFAARDLADFDAHWATSLDAMRSAFPYRDRYFVKDVDT